MESRRKRRSSILKTRNSVGPDGGSTGSGDLNLANYQREMGVDVGGAVGGGVGVSSSAARSKRVSFSHTNQVKEFVNNTNSSTEGSLSKTSDFNQTMCGMDMDISYDMDQDVEAKKGDNDMAEISSSAIAQSSSSKSNANETHFGGEMSIMEPQGVAGVEIEVQNLRPPSPVQEHHLKSQQNASRANFTSAGGLDMSMSVMEPPPPPSYPAGDSRRKKNRTTISIPQDMSIVAPLRDGRGAEVLQKTVDFSHPTMCGDLDMDLSYGNGNDTGTSAKKRNPNRSSVSNANRTQIGADMSVMDPKTPAKGLGGQSMNSRASVSNANRTQIGADMSVMEPKTPSRKSISNRTQVGADMSLMMEPKTPPRKSVSNRTQVGAEMSLMMEPKTPVRGMIQNNNAQTPHYAADFTAAAEVDMSMSTVEEPFNPTDFKTPRKGKPTRRTISAPQDMSILEPHTGRVSSAGPAPALNKTQDFFNPTMCEGLDMDMSSNQDDYDKGGHHDMPSLPNRTRIGADMSIAQGVSTPGGKVLPSAKTPSSAPRRRESIVPAATADVDMSMSTMEPPPPSTPRRSNRKTITNPHDMSMTTMESPAPPTPDAFKSPRRSNRKTICNPQDMSMTTMEPPAPPTPDAFKSPRRSSRRTISNPHDMSIVAPSHGGEKEPEPFGKAKDFNATIGGVGGDMNMSLNSSHVHDDVGKGNRRNRKSVGLSNRTQIGGEMSVMEPPVVAYPVPGVVQSVKSLSLAPYEEPQRSNFTVAGEVDMSMSAIDLDVEYAPAATKTPRKSSRKTISVPHDMSIALPSCEEAETFPEMGGSNPASKSKNNQSSTTLANQTQVAAEMSIMEPEPASSAGAASSATLQVQRQLLPVEIAPKITIRKSADQQRPQMYFDKPNPEKYRNPFGNRKTEKKQDDQAKSGQFSFGKFGNLKTPKRNRIPEPVVPVTKNLRPRAVANEEVQVQTSPMLMENNLAKKTMDIGLNCTLESNVQFKSVANTSMMTSPIVFPRVEELAGAGSSTKGKPAVETVDTGTSPIVTLASTSFSVNKSLISATAKPQPTEVSMSASASRGILKPNFELDNTAASIPADGSSMNINISFNKSQPAPDPAAAASFPGHYQYANVNVNPVVLSTSGESSSDSDSVEEGVEEGPRSPSPPAPVSSAICTQTELKELSMSVAVGGMNQNQAAKIPVPAAAPPREVLPVILASVAEESSFGNYTIDDKDNGEIDNARSPAPPSSNQTQMGTDADVMEMSIMTPQVLPPPAQENQAMLMIDDAFKSPIMPPQSVHLQRPEARQPVQPPQPQSQAYSPGPGLDIDMSLSVIEEPAAHLLGIGNSQGTCNMPVYVPTPTSVNPPVALIVPPPPAKEVEAEVFENDEQDEHELAPSPSFVLCAETFQEEMDDSESADAETNRATADFSKSVMFEMTNIQDDNSFRRKSNKTMENLNQSLAPAAGIQEPSLPLEEVEEEPELHQTKVNKTVFEPLQVQLQVQNASMIYHEISTLSSVPGGRSPAYKAMKIKLLNAPDPSDIYKYLDFKFSLTEELAELSDEEWMDIANSFKKFLGPTFTETVNIKRSDNARFKASIKYFAL